MLDRKIKPIFNFKDKTVIITGSSGQIGLSLIKLFLNLGSKVYGFDKKKGNLKDKNYKFFKLDITKKKNVNDKISEIIKKEKRIDVIINNAGHSIFSKYNNRTEKEINDTVNVNIKGVLNVINSYSEHHKKLNLKQCNIINLASIYGILSPDFRIYGKNDRFSSEIYGATKAAIIQLTKYYSVVLSKENIIINCISPGGILNEAKPQNKQFIIKYSKRVPVGRMGKVEDLYSGVLFLSSQTSKYVIGQNIVIDGGLSIW